MPCNLILHYGRSRLEGGEGGGMKGGEERGERKRGRRGMGEERGKGGEGFRRFHQTPFTLAHPEGPLEMCTFITHVHLQCTSA